MKSFSFIRLLLAVLFAASAFFFLGGCSSNHEREASQLPWARPANWEGGMPGGFGEQGRGSAF